MKDNARELEERLMDSSRDVAAACNCGAAAAGPFAAVGIVQQQQQQQDQEDQQEQDDDEDQQQQQQQLQLQQQMLLQRSSSIGERVFFRGLLLFKIFFGAALLLLLLLAAVHLDTTANLLREIIAGVQDLGGFAPFAYIALYVLFIACFLPAEFMHLAAGFIFSRIYGESFILAFNFIGSALGDLKDLDIQVVFFP
ncbi:hypothetical protein, conserved, partial [Eimeria maxima]